VARELGMRRVAVPLFAAGLSAWGMLHTDLRYEVARSEADAAGIPPDDAIRAAYASLESEGRARVAAWFGGTVEAHRAADMRYGEQVFEIAVPLNGLDWDAPGLAERVREAFHQRHEALFTYALRGEEVVLVNARLAVVGRLPAMAAAEAPRSVAPAAPIATRRVLLAADGGGAAEAVPVFDFAALAADQGIAGPAIVESDTTTVLLLPGDAARMDARGWLDVAVPASSG
jgi:N-methylhydantoinase A